MLTSLKFHGCKVQASYDGNVGLIPLISDYQARVMLLSSDCEFIQI